MLFKWPVDKSSMSNLAPSSCLSKDTSPLEILEDLAFFTIYRSVIDALVQRGEGSLEQAREAARQHLSVQLRGNVEESKDIRTRLLKHYNQEKETCRTGQALQLVRFSDFMDVVLDETVEEVRFAFDPYTDYDDQILPTILGRCPTVRKLHVQCSDRLVPVYKEAFGTFFNQLCHLVCLNLYKLPTECKEILSVIGKTCPKLQNLQISFYNHVLSTTELFGLFFAGELSRLNEAAKSADDATDESSHQLPYHRCLVSPKLLHPFCQHLESVRLNRYEGDGNPSVVAFVLRHLPRLTHFNTSDFEFKDFSQSIQTLWAIWEPSVTDSAVVQCLEPYHPLIPDGKTTTAIFDRYPDLIVQSRFTGKLSLTSLFLEGEKPHRKFSSICDLCPKLGKLEILETTLRNNEAAGETVYTLADVQASFSKLNKLRVFICTESDGPLCATITQATADFLTNLEMALDDGFVPKFDFLTKCANLRVLKLSTEFHPPLKSYFDQPVCPADFLPKLEEVQLDFCMNAELEELFLKKSSLTHIEVLCLHHLGQTEEQLLTLFLQWPKLVNFKYKMPRKFTADMVLQLLSNLPHLRSISLYKDIKYRCSGDFHQLKKACRERQVKLDLHLFVDTYLCVNGDVNDEVASTSDESETDS